MAEDTLYFVDRTEGMPASVYGVSLAGQGRSPQQILLLEDGSIDTVAQAKGADGGNILVLAGKDGEQAPFLEAYTTEGCQLWRRFYETQGDGAPSGAGWQRIFLCYVRRRSITVRWGRHL